MKRRSKFGSVVFGLMFVAGFASATCTGPYCWNDGQAYIDSNSGLQLSNFEGGLINKTTTQMATYVPKATGQLIYCSAGCPNAGTVCISTGTGTGAWVLHGGTQTVNGFACDGGL